MFECIVCGTEVPDGTMECPECHVWLIQPDEDDGVWLHQPHEEAQQ